jgi:hypothetical protein
LSKYEQKKCQPLVYTIGDKSDEIVKIKIKRATAADNVNTEKWPSVHDTLKCSELLITGNVALPLF